MRVQTIERPIDAPTRDDEPMGHISEPPYTHGVCGVKLVGIDADDQPLDCVVCAAMTGLT